MNFSIDFENLFYEVKVGAFITDAEGNIILFNPKAKDLFLSAFGKTSHNEETSEISLVKLLIHAKKYFVSNSTRETETTVINRKVKCSDINNKVTWFNVSSVPIFNIAGEFSQVLYILIDTTEEVAIEDSLKNISNSTGVVQYSIPPDGKKFLFINQAVKNISGYSSESIMDYPVLLVKQIAGDDFKFYKKFVKEIRKGIPSFTEYRVTTASGEQKFLKNYCIPVLQDNNIIRFDGEIHDITMMKDFQKRLVESEKFYRLLIDTSMNLIFTLDRYGYIITVNKSGASSLEYSTEELAGKHILEFVSEAYKTDIAVMLQQILRSEKSISFEAVFLNKSNNEIHFEINGRSVKNGNEISGLLGIGRNITEQRKAEEKLKELNSKLTEANKIISLERDKAKQQVNVLEEVNKLKSEFISNISHELRTPLASIVGFSETISGDPDLPKEMATEFNNIILSEGKRLARLINDFLDFAKIEAGKMDLEKTVINLTDLLLEIINKTKSFASEKGVIFTSQIPQKEVLVFGDKERIGQVFNQLITNAIKFTNPDGKVSLNGQDFNKEYEVIISDNGIGIPEKELHKVFQKFFKVENPGTLNTGAGIGLGLAKQIIDLHGGLITVQSEKGKGTTFIVRLPKM
jgi:PAS domain S-box-containing protein